MIEDIECNGRILAMLLRSTYKEPGIKFFTPDEYSQQLAYMNRPQGYVIQPHINNSVPRQVQFTKEVLFIKSGTLESQDTFVMQPVPSSI